MVIKIFKLIKLIFDRNICSTSDFINAIDTVKSTIDVNKDGRISVKEGIIAIYEVVVSMRRGG